MKCKYAARKFWGLVSLGLLALPGFAIGGIWTAGLIPEQPYVHSTWGYMVLQDTTDPEVINPDNCSIGNNYLVSKDVALAKDMYAMLLAANVSKQKVAYYLHGCVDGYFPAVLHVRIIPD